MKDNSSDPLIDVAQLKLGMFIHLDLGWMAHPFPLSSFKLSSEDQLAVLRRLGLKQVRWSPGKSDLQMEASPLPEPVAAAPAATAEPQSEADRAKEAHRHALQAQRDALAVCEQQYGEAAAAFKAVIELVPQAPQDARDQAIALTKAMLDKMLVARRQYPPVE